MNSNYLIHNFMKVLYVLDLRDESPILGKNTAVYLNGFLLQPGKDYVETSRDITIISRQLQLDDRVDISNGYMRHCRSGLTNNRIIV